ncbi:hypothetical protein ES703_60926 [subsurface metagenome]
MDISDCTCVFVFIMFEKALLNVFETPPIKVSRPLSAKLVANTWVSRLPPASLTAVDTVASIHGSRYNSSPISNPTTATNLSAFFDTIARVLALEVAHCAMVVPMVIGTMLTITLIKVIYAVYAAELSFVCVEVAMECWYVYSRMDSWAACMVAIRTTSSEERSLTSSSDLYFST